MGSDKPQKSKAVRGLTAKADLGKKSGSAPESGPDALGAVKAARDEAVHADAPQPPLAKKAPSKSADAKGQSLPANAKSRAGGTGPRRGFGLFGLALGLAAGLIAYALTEFWIDVTVQPTAAQALLVFVGVTTAALLLTAGPSQWLRGAFAAPVIGALIAGPTAYMLSANVETRNLSTFPPMFWFLVGAPLAGLLLIALARAALSPRGERYTELFSSGVTLPLVAAGSAVFALLGVVLLYSWAALMRSMNVNLFHQLFQQPWFMLPFIGAMGGLSIGLIKSLEPVLGALRYGTLLLARFAMPLTAVFSVAFLGVLLLKGPGALFGAGFAGPALLGLALVGMLIFNGVYQNGEGAPPPAWLRLSTIAALVAFPAYSGLAAVLFAERIGELGLTPARFAGLVFSSLAALYSVVGLAGVVTEFRWHTARWMPAVARLNAGMAILWAMTLLLLASPLVNSWALSARDQERRILSGRADVETFDYGYMRFALGDAGAAALTRLSQTTAHPKADAIRAGAARALAAATYSLYRNPPEPALAPMSTPAPPQTAPERTGVDALDFNPKDSGGD